MDEIVAVTPYRAPGQYYGFTREIWFLLPSLFSILEHLDLRLDYIMHQIPEMNLWRPT